MIRWLSIGVIAYMILGIIWWGLLLLKNNEALYQARLLNVITVHESGSLENHRDRQRTMILGEGLVLVLSLMVGVYIINRSAKKEIQSATQLNNFLLSVSHELKSPIAAIKLALQTVTRPHVPKEKESKFLHSAIEDTKRLEILVQNILLSANLEDKELELFQSKMNISDVLRKLANQYRTDHPDRTLEVISSHDNIEIQADQQHLRQAFINLLDNAIKYSLDHHPITIHLNQQDKEVEVKFINDGPPIHPKERDKIFEKFYRVKSSSVRKKEGAGIGLYITRQVVEAHGGTISVSSKEGMNQFRLTLPYES